MHFVFVVSACVYSLIEHFRGHISEFLNDSKAFRASFVHISIQNSQVTPKGHLRQGGKYKPICKLFDINF